LTGRKSTGAKVDGYRDTFGSFDRLIGFDRLHVLHANTGSGHAAAGSIDTNTSATAASGSNRSGAC
jgi:hypothetical protein